MSMFNKLVVEAIDARVQAHLLKGKLKVINYDHI